MVGGSRTELITRPDTSLRSGTDEGVRPYTILPLANLFLFPQITLDRFRQPGGVQNVAQLSRRDSLREVDRFRHGCMGIA